MALATYCRPKHDPSVSSQGVPYVPPSPAKQIVASVIQLSWSFILFGSIILFMGILRVGRKFFFQSPGLIITPKKTQ